MSPRITAPGYVGPTWVGAELGIHRVAARALMMTWPETQYAPTASKRTNRVRLAIADAERRCSEVVTGQLIDSNGGEFYGGL